MNKSALFGAAALILLAHISSATDPVFSQTSQPASVIGNSGSSMAGASAPLYSQKNFEADARAENLYSYNNPTSMIKPAWNTYNLEVQQLAAKAAPVQQAQNATTSGINNPGAGLNSVIKQFAGLSSSLRSRTNSVSSPSPFNNQASPTSGGTFGSPQSASNGNGEPGAMTSVNGKLQIPQDASVPGLSP